MTNYSTILNQEQDPEKLRQFYKQFCMGIKNNKRKTQQGNFDEVNLLDLLQDLRLIGAEGSSPPHRAVASPMINQQRYKFYVGVQPETITPKG